MEMFGKIRRMYLRDKLSLHEITKRTGLSRNTIRRWVRSTKETAPPTYSRGDAPCKLTAFHEALEQALKADAHRTKQNRRTAKALFRREAPPPSEAFVQQVLDRLPRTAPRR